MINLKYTTLGQTNIKTTAIYTHLNEEKYAKKMQEYNFDKDLYDTQVERKSKKNSSKEGVICNANITRHMH